VTVSQRITSTTIAGTLGGFVGVDLPFAVVSDSLRITRVDFRVTDAPSGGTVDVMINNTPGGAGTKTVPATIADGTRHASVTADVLLEAGETLYLRVTDESGSAMGLSASVELSLLTGQQVTVFLSTLPNVKDSAGISGTGDDLILTRHLEAVSRGMQNYMAREIPKIIYTDERHFPTGLNSALVLSHDPIVSVEGIRVGNVALTSDDWRIEGGRLLRRVSSDLALNWTKGTEVEVDYTAGYENIPSDLVDACTQEVLRRWFQTPKGGGDGAHVVSTTPETGDSTAYTQEEWMPQTLAVMRTYRRMF